MVRMNRKLRSDPETTNDLIDHADFTLSLSLFLSLAQLTTHKFLTVLSLYRTVHEDRYDKVFGSFAF